MVSKSILPQSLWLKVIFYGFKNCECYIVRERSNHAVESLENDNTVMTDRVKHARLIIRTTQKTIYWLN